MIFGYVASAVGVTGSLLLTHRRVSGWWVCFVGLVMWAAYGWSKTDWPLVVNSFVFAAVYMYGIWKWRRDAGQVDR